MSARRAVWKFEVEAFVASDLEMPKGARIVHVEHQRNAPEIVTFWAEVRPDAEREVRSFFLAGTGHPIPEGATYVGTDCVDRTLVLHVYEVPRCTRSTARTASPPGATRSGASVSSASRFHSSPTDERERP